jgi:hypothetical protein
VGLVVVLLIVLTPYAAAAQTETQPYAVVFDSYMTPAAGAEDLLALQHVLASVEDRWLPLKLGGESTRRGLAAGILYRTGKFIGLDVPQDHLLMVVAHEVFGHGARFRELGDGTIGYGFDAPIPYGSGDAFTRFSGRFPVSPLAHLNVSASGIEAQHVLADGIAARSAARGRLHYREAWLYFESRITGMTYILSARFTVDAQVSPAAFAAGTRRSDALLRHLRICRCLYRERGADGARPDDSDRKRDPRIAFARLRAGAVRRRMESAIPERRPRGGWEFGATMCFG